MNGMPIIVRTVAAHAALQVMLACRNSTVSAPAVEIIAVLVGHATAVLTKSRSALVAKVEFHHHRRLNSVPASSLASTITGVIQIGMHQTLNRLVTAAT